MNEVKQVLGSMRTMLDTAHAMRDSFREDSCGNILTEV